MTDDIAGLVKRLESAAITTDSSFIAKACDEAAAALTQQAEELAEATKQAVYFSEQNVLIARQHDQQAARVAELEKALRNLVDHAYELHGERLKSMRPGYLCIVLTSEMWRWRKALVALTAEGGTDA